MEQKRPETGYNFRKDLKRLWGSAIHHLVTHELASHGNHDFKQNHLPVPDSEAIEPAVDHWDAHGYPVYADDDLYLGQNPAPGMPYRHPFDARETKDTREL